MTTSITSRWTDALTGEFVFGKEKYPLPFPLKWRETNVEENFRNKSPLAVFVKSFWIREIPFYFPSSQRKCLWKSHGNVQRFPFSIFALDWYSLIDNGHFSWNTSTLHRVKVIIRDILCCPPSTHHVVLSMKFCPWAPGGYQLSHMPFFNTGWTHWWKQWQLGIQIWWIRQWWNQQQH